MFFSGGADYVNEEALKNLKFYKYGSADKSYLSYYILNPYWTWAVQFFPRSMAPNLITLTGFGFMLANLLLMTYKLPDLIGPTDAWVYFSFAIGLFLYQTFDNVDGKQARRTGSSSPLGELFDHGCDALNCSVGGIIQAAAMGFGNSWMSVFVPYIAIIAFYFTTWEEYHTGVLYLGHINGPTEGLVMASIIMALSGVYGPHIWKLPLNEVAPKLLSSSVFATWTLSDVLAASLLLILVFFQIPSSLYMVHRACKRKGKSFRKTLVQFLPLLIYVASAYLWLQAPQSIVLKEHVALFVITTGIVFGRIATKIILAYVTRMEFPMFTIMLMPLVVGAFLANAPQWLGITVFTPTTERLYLWAYFVFVLFAYMHWALLVIDRFCKHLHIRCLSIPYTPAEKQPPQKTTKSAKSSPTVLRRPASPRLAAKRASSRVE